MTSFPKFDLSNSSAISQHASMSFCIIDQEWLGKGDKCKCVKEGNKKFI